MNLLLIGSSGSGISSAGEILLDALLCAGYHIVAEREYPSVIKGGCALYRIEVSSTPVFGIHKYADVVVALDRTGSQNALQYIKNGGVLIFGDEHHTSVPGFLDTIEKKQLQTIYIPEFTTPKKLDADILLSNMLFVGILWRILGLDIKLIEEAVKKQFAHKPAALALDLKLIKHGFELYDTVTSGKMEEWKSGIENPILPSRSPANPPSRQLLNGNECLALSAIHHGVKAYFAYPMSPASTILSYLSEGTRDAGMYVEQADDEISAVQMALGASYGGIRSLTATSGGGFDLMTETISLAGMIEVPLVIILAQRPGPATGLPTWSAQEDLNLAIHSGHGEYPKVVMSISSPEDAFSLLGEAFDISEMFKIPVILLTEKSICDTTMSLDMDTLKGPGINRINESLQNITKTTPLIRGGEKFLKSKFGTDRIFYKNFNEERKTKNEELLYFNGDEHRPDGTVTEVPEEVAEARNRRKTTMKEIESTLPEPTLYGNPKAKITLVGWGSIWGELKDFISCKECNGNITKNDKRKTINAGDINYLHYSYLFPLKTETIKKLKKRGNRIIVMEHNMTGQLASLLEAKGITSIERWNKYDGRRFYYEEIEEGLVKICTKKNFWQ